MSIEKLREHVLANRQSIAYALGGFSTGVLGTLFGMFNVMFFTRVVGLDNSFFYTGHIVYGIWNAVNDPAFGWLIDHTANRANRRLPVIKYGGPLWCFFLCSRGILGVVMEAVIRHFFTFFSACFATMVFLRTCCW